MVILSQNALFYFNFVVLPSRSFRGAKLGKSDIVPQSETGRIIGINADCFGGGDVI